MTNNIASELRPQIKPNPLTYIATDEARMAGLIARATPQDQTSLATEFLPKAETSVFKAALEILTAHTKYPPEGWEKANELIEYMQGLGKGVHSR